jgi:hypothetical protein
MLQAGMCRIAMFVVNQSEIELEMQIRGQKVFFEF